MILPGFGARAAKDLFNKWRFGGITNFLIIDDKGPGTSLIQRFAFSTMNLVQTLVAAG
jgi:hypothetical protein